jgi:hypothetical protein
MKVEKRQVDGRHFWFTIEQPYAPDPETGELTQASGYYVAFSVREPSAMIAGEFVKDDHGRVKLFSTPDEALQEGIKEVKARLRTPAKAFAVGLPGGTKDAEFQAYVKLLKDRGIELDKPRVEDSFGRKWLHVWENRDEAEKFAAHLRKETRNPSWEVYELVPPTPETQVAAEDRGPIVILVGRQSDGNTYELHPNSLKLLRKKFPRIKMKPSVFVGRETQADYEENAGNSMYDQVVTLLTGLDVTRVLDSFGGYRVVDPVSNLTLWQETK